MVKWCFNYESGDYEYIEKDGFSIDRGEYVYNWDDSEYRREEEECRNSLFDDEDDDWDDWDEEDEEGVEFIYKP